MRVSCPTGLLAARLQCPAGVALDFLADPLGCLWYSRRTQCASCPPSGRTDLLAAAAVDLVDRVRMSFVVEVLLQSEPADGLVLVIAESEH